MDGKLARDADLPAYAKSLIRIKARQLKKQLGLSRSDEEDLRQILATSLIQHLPNFDPNRAGQNTFIARVVDSVIKMYLRDRKRKKRGGGRIVRSLDATVDVDQGRPISRAQVINEADHSRRLGTETLSESDRIEQRLDVEGVLANLPPNLREVCRRWRDGSEASVARDLGISRRQVRDLMEQVRRRFQAAGLEKS